MVEQDLESFHFFRRVHINISAPWIAILLIFVPMCSFEGVAYATLKQMQLLVCYESQTLLS